jgi:hypothetical protein
MNNMQQEDTKQKIILSDELQESILNFFMKTSIPRKARQERMKNNFSEKGEEKINENSGLCSR